MLLSHYIFQCTRPGDPPTRRFFQAQGRVGLLREREPARRGPLQRAGLPRQEEDARRHQDLGGEARCRKDPRCARHCHGGRHGRQLCLRRPRVSLRRLQHRDWGLSR